MLLSFVIPVYNCEPYLRACLDSVFSIPVEETDYEVVLVDDGTPDGSLKIVEEFAREHSNIVLLHEKNSGASTARNYGLSVAKGRYVWFVDSDDRIFPDVAKPALAAMERDESLEMVCFNYQTKAQDSDRQCMVYPREEILSGEEYLLRFRSYFLWNRIYRRSAIRVAFVEGTKNLEDMYFNVCNISKMEKIMVTPNIGYCYNHLNSSSTSLSRDLRNLVKLNLDTWTFVGLMQRQMSEAKSAGIHAAFGRIVSDIIAGHIYSLLMHYNMRFVRKAIAEYKRRDLWPVAYTPYGLKMNLFIWAVNHPRLLLAAGRCWHYKNVVTRK